MNAYTVVAEFERKVAEYAGAKHGVAVDCCSNAIFLCAKYLDVKHVVLPARTYISVPMAFIHAGASVDFEDYEWRGTYQCKPSPIIDGAKRFRRGMFEGGYHCLSFHMKKHIPIGKGGMILTDNGEAADWFRKSRYDGRESGRNFMEESVTMLGWHCYMMPDQASRGLALLEGYNDKPDLTEAYPDLRRMPVFAEPGRRAAA